MLITVNFDLTKTSTINNNTHLMITNLRQNERTINHQFNWFSLLPKLPQASLDTIGSAYNEVYFDDLCM